MKILCLSAEQVTMYLPGIVTFYYYAFKYKDSMLLNEIESSSFIHCYQSVTT